MESECWEIRVRTSRIKRQLLLFGGQKKVLHPLTPRIHTKRASLNSIVFTNRTYYVLDPMRREWEVNFPPSGGPTPIVRRYFLMNSSVNLLTPHPLLRPMKIKYYDYPLNSSTSSKYPLAKEARPTDGTKIVSLDLRDDPSEPTVLQLEN